MVDVGEHYQRRLGRESGMDRQNQTCSENPTAMLQTDLTAIRLEGVQ